MTPVLALITWISLGAIAAIATSPPSQRCGWVPMAIFMGPFWLAVATDLERTRATINHHADGHAPKDQPSSAPVSVDNKSGETKTGRGWS